MADIFEAEYGRPFTVPFALWSPTAENFATGLTPVAGDSQVSIDGAAPANTANIFGGAGLGFSLPLTAAEMSGAVITLHIVDAPTKAWLDKDIEILTYGHPLAHDPRGVFAVGTAQAGDTNEITLAAGESATNDVLVGAIVEIIDGTGAGQTSRVIVDYDGTTKVATVDPVWVFTPDATSVYRVYSTPPSAGISMAVQAALVAENIATGDTVINTGQAILDALLSDTYAVPGQGAPPTNPTLAQALLYGFKLGVHEVQQTASEFRLLNRAGTQVDQKAASSDDGTTYTRASLGTGP